MNCVLYYQVLIEEILITKKDTLFFECISMGKAASFREAKLFDHGVAPPTLIT